MKRNDVIIAGSVYHCPDCKEKLLLAVKDIGPSEVFPTALNIKGIGWQLYYGEVLKCPYCNSNLHSALFSESWHIIKPKG